MHSGCTAFGRGIGICLLLGLGLCAYAAPDAPAAAPGLLWQSPESGEAGGGGGQLERPRGVAASPVDGHLFVADADNARISEFDAWGQFVKAWGWGVVASGPDNEPPVNERQQLTVDAIAGTYKLRYINAYGGGKSGVQTTAAIPFDASAATVQAALGGLESLEAGDVSVSGGPGGPGGATPYTIEFTGEYADRDIPPLRVVEPVEPGLSGSVVVATLQAGGSFEVCRPSAGDVCQAGQSGGASAGELPRPYGVAVDGAGDVYVDEVQFSDFGESGKVENFRVQKFDPEGNFLWAAGGEVDKTKAAEGSSSEAERNLCTAAEVEAGDVCGAGTPGTGNAQFGETFIVGSRIAIGPGGDVFVGDVGRIQELGPDGHYIGDVPDPEGILAGETIRSLAMDAAGDFHLDYAESGSAGLGQSKDNVDKLGPAGTEIPPSPFRPIDNPWGLALDSVGSLYATETHDRIVEFGTDGSETIGPGEEFGKAQQLGGLATSSACEIPPPGDVFATAHEAGGGYSLRAYGPPPQDVTACPPPEVPPIVNEQFVATAGPDGATVEAKINPVFHPDTRYYVEYGTGRCSEGGCTHSQPIPPGSKLTDEITNAPLLTAGVFLSGLEPATTYHYRFVAESSGGGPIRGVGGTESADGAEDSFQTMARRPQPPSSDPCPNAAFRGGAAAFLPDCRAYEMVTPIEKNSGDVIAFLASTHERATLDQASSDGGRLAYGTYRSFGDEPSAPFTSAYLATRVPGQEWRSEGISPPRGTPLVNVVNEIYSQFKAFSPDLCTSWLVHDAEPVLAAGAPEGFPGVYRREGCGAAGSYTPLVTSAPPVLAPALFLPSIQGISADGSHVLIQAEDRLAPGGAQCTEVVVFEASCTQLYLSDGSGPLHSVCILPSGRAPDMVEAPAHPLQEGGCSAGTSTEPFLYQGRGESVDNALSADGSKVYWSDRAEEEGKIFARVNPTMPESAQEHGRAVGSGDLVGPAAGIGNTAANSPLIKGVVEEDPTSGPFTAGQTLVGEGIEPETTIVEVQRHVETKPGSGKFEDRLKLDKQATANASGVALSAAGLRTVSNVSASEGEFEPGQSILGPGIPPGTTVVAVGGSTLELSAAATKTYTGVDLDAFSRCTEADMACTVPVSEGPAQYLGASEDGERALFSVGGLNAGEAELYEFDLGKEEATPIAGEVSGLLGTSSDARRIYLVSGEALGAGASAGKPNLYLHEAGGGFTFIRTLAAADGRQEAEAYSPVNTRPNFHTAQVSADGAHVAFMSRGRLTGRENTDVASGQPDAEVFLYGVGEGLRCVSCNPTGARPSGREITLSGSGPPNWAASRIAVNQTQLYTDPQVLSPDGRRLFFESFQALVPADTNGREDVYEWEAPGKGNCSATAPFYSSQAEGCVALISSGEGSDDSELVGVDAGGANAFFATSQSLLPQDPGLIDIYDARVEGGLPIPQGPAPFCEGEACQSPPPPPPPPAPSSSSFHGPANPRAAKPGRRCPKGKRLARRGGKARCVPKRRKHAHRRHHRRHHDRRHAR